MYPTPYRNLAAELEALDARIQAFLPPRYQPCYTSVSPYSMGSAQLKYGPDGRVAWGEIWTNFCDLALAGGPPHRGKLLEPVTQDQAAAMPGRYRKVIAEIRRAIDLTTCLPVVEGYLPGWVGVQCATPAEAAWLQFAVTAENVSARRRDDVLQLPAGPQFRDEKEIKNVIVALAKSYHYWEGHLTDAQQSLAGEAVWEPAGPAEASAAPADYAKALSDLEDRLHAAAIPIMPRRYTGWVGIQTASDEAAVWLLRAVLVEQVLARRENDVLYLPVSAQPGESQSLRVCQAMIKAWDLWTRSPRRQPTWRSSPSRGT